MEVELPDGTILELPDGADEATIRNAAQRAMAMSQQPQQPQGSATGATLSGMNKSIASLVGAPVDLVNFGLKQVGMGSERPFMGSDQITDWMRSGRMVGNNPGYEGYERFGENLGTGLLTTLTAGAAAPALAARGATTAANVARAMGPGASAAGTLGREVVGAGAQTLGGEAARSAGAGPLGQFLAEMVAGTAPSALAAGAKSGMRAMWAKPNGQSARDFATLEQAGITPRPGLVGNSGMARIENTYSQVPIAGALPARRFGDSFREFQTSLYGATDDIAPRAVPDLEQPAGADMIGARMRIAANDGNANMSREFGQRYDQFFDEVPADTLVRPDNTRAVVAGQNSPLTGESQATRGSVNQFVESEINPGIVAEQGPTMSGAPIDREGMPIQIARKARTEAFYDAQGGKMVGGATDQVRGGLTRDIEQALLNDERMVQAFPDPAARQAQVDRLRVLDTEYATSRATNVSPAGGTVIGDRLYTGGDKRALDQVANAQSDNSAFNLGSEPGRMAALQRNATDQFPEIAADTVRQKAQGRNPFGDINVSPQVYAQWWNGLSPNEKMIFTNEGFDPRRSIPMSEVANAGPTPPTPVMNNLDRLGAVGEIFRQRSQNANPSGTAPTLATLGIGTGIFTSPAKTLGILGSGALGGAAVSSRTLAEILAGVGDTSMEQILKGGARAANRAALTPGG